jgi:hypothetical protein
MVDGTAFFLGINGAEPVLFIQQDKFCRSSAQIPFSSTIGSCRGLVSPATIETIYTAEQCTATTRSFKRPLPALWIFLGHQVDSIYA